LGRRLEKSGEGVEKGGKSRWEAKNGDRKREQRGKRGGKGKVKERGEKRNERG